MLSQIMSNVKLSILLETPKEKKNTLFYIIIYIAAVMIFLKTNVSKISRINNKIYTVRIFLNHVKINWPRKKCWRPSVSLVRKQNLYGAACPFPLHFYSTRGYSPAPRYMYFRWKRRLFLELERFRLQSFTFVLFLKPYTTDVISKQLSPRHTQFKA